MAREHRDTVMNKFHSMVIVAVAACVLCLLLAACGMSTEEQWQEQYDLGQQYLLDGDYEQAIVAFSAAIEIDPNVADAYLGRAEAYLGGDIETASTENLNLALADYDAAIELDETLTEAFVSRGDVHVALGTEEDLEEAISDYSSAISLDDTKAEYYVRRGDVYVALGTEEDLEEAIADYTSAITLDDTNAEVYVSRGDTYVAMDANSEENLTAAIADYDSAIALDDTLTELYLTEAALYIETGDYAGAVEAYTDAIEADLGNSEVYLGRAGAYYELAMAETDAAASAEEADSLSDSAIEHFNDALADYLRALELGEDSEDIYLGISKIYILLEDYDSAEAILEQGLQSYPESVTIVYQLEKVTQQIEQAVLITEFQEYILNNLAEWVPTAVAQCEEHIEACINSEASSTGFVDENLLPDDYDEFVEKLKTVMIDSVMVELDDGNWIVVYPTGRIYYGEMENGQRSGHGAFFTFSCILKKLQSYVEQNGITGYGIYGLEGYFGEWSDDEANGYGYYIDENEIYYMNFVDGAAEGEGTLYYVSSVHLQIPITAEEGSITEFNGEAVEEGEIRHEYNGYNIPFKASLTVY